MFENIDIRLSSVLLIILLAQPLCIFAHQSSLSPSSSASDGSSPPSTPPPRSPQSQFDLGPFTLSLFANETKYQDKMRFSKAYLNLVLSAPIIGQLSSVKISRLDELVRCESVNLIKPDIEPLLDCRPLESYVREGLHETVPKSTGGASGGGSKNNNLLYVRRVTVRAKAKSPLFEDLSGRQDIIMYPLRDDVVRRNVKSILAANNLSSADFADSVSDEYGIYMETEMMAISCTANIFMSFNDSIQYNPFNANANSNSTSTSTSASGSSGGGGEPTTPESVVQEFVDFFNEVQRDGFFFSVQDASCGRDDFLIPFSVDQDFTLAVRNKFPYLTLQHNIGSKPLDNLWNYSGKIMQTRDETQPGGQGDQPEAYNTSIQVNSRSSILNSLSFNIDQNFVKENATSGFEKMILAHDKLIAIVRSNWSPDIFVKWLQLFPLPPMKEGTQSPPLLLIYDDEAKDEYIGLKFKILRKYLSKLMGDNSTLEEDDDENYESTSWSGDTMTIKRRVEL